MAFRNRSKNEYMALPFGDVTANPDPRALSILARTIYRELRSNGFQARDVVALAGELLSLVTNEVQSNNGTRPPPKP